MLYALTNQSGWFEQVQDQRQFFSALAFQFVVAKFSLHHKNFHHTTFRDFATGTIQKCYLSKLSHIQAVQTLAIDLDFASQDDVTWALTTATRKDTKRAYFSWNFSLGRFVVVTPSDTISSSNLLQQRNMPMECDWFHKKVLPLVAILRKTSVKKLKPPRKPENFVSL